jgi:hypothetical protein
MKTNFTINITTLIIIGIIIIGVVIGGYGLFNGKLNNVQDKLKNQIKLNQALNDSLIYTKNKLGEVEATKISLQSSLANVKERNNQLSENQKELIKRIDNLKNKNDLISAALVESEVVIDSLKNIISDTTIINKEDSTITFVEKSDSLNFDISVGKVLPASDIYNPTLSINRLVIPNKQFITFKFDDNDQYYQTPVKFTISNSNSLVKTVGADSYIIPNINPDVVNPSFSEKLKKFFNKPTVKIITGTIIFGSGVYIGTIF